MILTDYRFFKLSAVLSLALLTACATPLVLESKSAAVPVGVNFNGNWLVRGGGPRNGMAGTPGVLDQKIRIDRTQGPQRKRSSGPSVQVFLEYGTSLKITHTGYGMFISYDRSIVEEYSFGENRMVEVGPIEALRVSGWEGESFVVETLDDSDTILFETWHLENDGNLLVRNVRISKGGKDSFVDKQLYDRF